MKHFTSFLDLSVEDVQKLADLAAAIKLGNVSPKHIRGKSLAMMFFNPSLRTRLSFELAMTKFGGSAISFSASGDAWALEFEDGAVMNGTTVEHVKDAAKVLSRYVDAIAIRSFGKLQSLEEDLKEQVLTGFKTNANVPVVSMESACEHPAQCLADLLTIKERSQKRGKFVLSWAPHIKALPTAVPHSALLCGVHSGYDVVIAHPKGYELADSYLANAKQVCDAKGSSLTITNDQNVLNDADVVYAKNWAPPALYQDPAALSESLASNSEWLVTADKTKSAHTLLHCLPVRRNLEVADDALDADNSAIYPEAENRLWAQAAVLETLFSHSNR